MKNLDKEVVISNIRPMTLLYIQLKILANLSEKGWRVSCMDL